MTSLSDLALENATDDSLGRDVLAGDIAKCISSLPLNSSLTLAICGPWGSGKTSLFNLTRRRLEKTPQLEIMTFNPWFFSDAENLTRLFLSKFANRLRVKDPKLKRASKLIGDYGQGLATLSVIPHIGPWAVIAGWFSKFFGKSGNGDSKFLGMKNRIAAELIKSKTQFIIFIDDIDRLELREILDIFKLVRLTADFPNLIYVLAFDRKQVLKILDSGNIDGQAYLEKIVSVTVDIPVASEQILTSDLTNLIDKELSGILQAGKFDSQRWPDVFIEIIRPLISNHRDAKRYVATLKLTLSSIGKDIEIVDLLALEAIRLFCQDFFDSLISIQDLLTDTSSLSNSKESNKSRLQSMLSNANTPGSVATSTVDRLFPAASKYISNTTYDGQWLKSWLKDKRVAHPKVLGLYLERYESPELKAFAIAKSILALAGTDDLVPYLSQLDHRTLADSISALETFEDEYPAEIVVPLAVAVLNTLPQIYDLPQQAFLEIRPVMVIARVVLRLLRSLPPEEIDGAVLKILSGLQTLSAKLALIELIGHRENRGQKLASLSLSKQLEVGLIQEIRRTPEDTLIQEADLLALLLTPAWWDPQSPRILPESIRTNVIQAVFSAAVSYGFEQGIGSRASRRVSRLQWEALIEIFGGAEEIERALARVDGLETNSEDALEAIRLIKEKLSQGVQLSEAAEKPELN